jgi:outer membrane lipoprotein-sorting protein
MIITGREAHSPENGSLAQVCTFLLRSKDFSRSLCLPFPGTFDFIVIRFVFGFTQDGKQQDMPSPDRCKIFLQSLLICAISLAAIGSVNAVGVDTVQAKMTSDIVEGVVYEGRCTVGDPFIGEMINRTKELNNYTCDYQMMVEKKPSAVKETGTMYFRRPRLMRVEVKSGPKKGALAVLAQDGKVHGHMGGLLKHFSGAVSPDSDFVRAINGFPMVGTDFFSLASYLKVEMLDKGDKSIVSTEPVATKHTPGPTYIVDMFRASADGKQLLKRIYVDPQSFLPVYWEDYKDGKLWSVSSWSGLRTNQPLADNLFSG